MPMATIQEDGDDAQVPGLALAFGRGDKARAAR